MPSRHRRKREEPPDPDDELGGASDIVCERLDALIEVGEDQLDLLGAINDKLQLVLDRGDQLQGMLKGLGDGGGLLGKFMGFGKAKSE